MSVCLSLCLPVCLFVCLLIGSLVCECTLRCTPPIVPQNDRPVDMPHETCSDMTDETKWTMSIIASTHCVAKSSRPSGGRLKPKIITSLPHHRAGRAELRMHARSMQTPNARRGATSPCPHRTSGKRHTRARLGVHTIRQGWQ